MGLDLAQFRRWVVAPVLEYLAPEIPHTRASEKLVLGIALHESAGLVYIDQKESRADHPGPALGLYQIEPETHRDLWFSWLPHRPGIEYKLRSLRAPWPTSLQQLRTNPVYGTGITRANLFRWPERLPDEDDVDGLASYAKRYHNSVAGKATVDDYRRAILSTEALYA